MVRRKLSKALARIDALTLRRIAQGTYRTRTRNLHDGGGLYVRLRPGGGSWMFKYQIDNRLHTMGLGSVVQVGAPEAREMARQFRGSLTLGEDPLHQRTEERRQRRAGEQASRTTFAEVAGRVLAAYDASSLTAKTRRSWRQVIEEYALPVLGSKRLDDITHADVLEVLRPVWGTKPSAGRRARRRIEHILDEARTLGLTDKPNVARYADLKRSLAAFVAERPPAHHKALPWRQVPALMKRLAVDQDLASYALRLTILAATRTGETLGARFDELAHGTWTIPAERMKGENGRRRAHRVPIATGVAELVEQLKSVRRGPLLFAGRDADKPIGSRAMLLKLRGLEIDATVHGFRSTFRDWCADNGVAREVAEAALAHVVGGVEGSYFRSDLFEQRRELMQAWSRYCLTGQWPKKK